MMLWRRIGLRLGRWLILSVLILIFAAGAGAESPAGPPVVDRTIGDAVVALTGSWKFSPGDNMAWARPDFDDSAWGTQNLTPPAGSYDPVTGSSGFVPGWTSQGYPDLTGYGWYRLHLRLRNISATAGTVPLALAMPINFDDAYQVFVNGRMIGQLGRFGKHSVVFYNAQPLSFALPAGVESSDLTIAIRTWMDAATPLTSQDAGGLHGPPLIGESSAIDAMLRLDWDAVNRTQIGNLLASASLLLALVLGFTLYTLDRRETAYLLLGAVCLAVFVQRTTVMMGYYSQVLPMVPETVLLDVVLTPLTLGLWALFWAYWFKLERIRTISRLAWTLTAFLMLATAMVRAPLYGRLIPAGAGDWLLPIVLVLKLLLGALLLWVTYRGIRQRTADGWLALAPVLLTVLWAYQEELSVIHVPVILRILGVTISEGMIAILLMLAIISILMIRRFIRGQRESVVLRHEIEQARQVQQVLIPEALPVIPGFAVESEYRPAQEVGGDFFQILPVQNGGLIAVIGDVSGKGTPAAMTVSLLVGALRTLARSTQSPGEILAVLNERMIGRSQGGFTTCLVLRADADGTLTVANAGHLAPYLDGRELEMNSALPLGLAEESYPETTFHLDKDQMLTLVTDGILEARNKTGELFGFERLAEIAKGTAAYIVERAQEFGQGDDITVLTITRLAAERKPAFRRQDQVIATSTASC